MPYFRAVRMGIHNLVGMTSPEQVSDIPVSTFTAGVDLTRLDRNRIVGFIKPLLDAGMSAKVRFNMSEPVPLELVDEAMDILSFDNFNYIREYTVGNEIYSGFWPDGDTYWDWLPQVIERIKSHNRSALVFSAGMANDMLKAAREGDSRALEILDKNINAAGDGRYEIHHHDTIENHWANVAFLKRRVLELGNPRGMGRCWYEIGEAGWNPFVAGLDTSDDEATAAGQAVFEAPTLRAYLTDSDCVRVMKATLINGAGGKLGGRGIYDKNGNARPAKAALEQVALEVADGTFLGFGRHRAPWTLS